MKSSIYRSKNDTPVKVPPSGGDIQATPIRIIANVGTGQR